MSDDTNYLARFAVAAKAPFIRARAPEPVEPPKDVDFVRKQLRKYMESHVDSVITRETNGAVMPAMLHDFIESRAVPNEYQLSAIVSVVIPDFIFQNGKVTKGRFTPPITDNVKLAELRLDHKPRGSKLPVFDAPGLSQIEAVTVYNIIKDIVDPVSLRSIRDGVRQTLVAGVWGNETSLYVSERLQFIVSMLIAETTLTHVADEEGKLTLVKVHRSRLRWIKNAAGPVPD